jgi:hypothetical protein
MSNQAAYLAISLTAHSILPIIDCCLRCCFLVLLTMLPYRLQLKRLWLFMHCVQDEMRRDRDRQRQTDR